MMDLDDRKFDLEKRWYGGDLNKKKFEILRDTIENKENQIEEEIDKLKFQIQSLDKKSTWVNWLDIHFSRNDELRLVDEYEERRKWITKYIHEVLVLNYNKQLLNKGINKKDLINNIIVGINEKIINHIINIL